eukprot:TRINITY_DN2082_c0_g1_i1.p1 TRINITY_DN2082_c0_g1~~TRINITY_DN2082_c0_g1_i1.p1  ORF type:complete len:149 (+),score=14.04 TRINITY_DN2082_c0_g1_i1:52-498(+)
MASVKEISNIVAVTIRKEVPSSSYGSFLSASAILLLEFIKESGVEPTGPGFTIHHKSGDTQDVEVCIPVNKSGANRGEIHFKDLTGGKAVVFLLKGGYEGLKGAHEQVKQFCSANNHTVSQIREVYKKGPKETQNSGDWETEIIYLVS